MTDKRREAEGERGKGKRQETVFKEKERDREKSQHIRICILDEMKGARQSKGDERKERKGETHIK